jgi:hypothetical protein
MLLGVVPAVIVFAGLTILLLALVRGAPTLATWLPRSQRPGAPMLVP